MMTPIFSDEIIAKILHTVAATDAPRPAAPPFLGDKCPSRLVSAFV
jgi:hypothetical protein